MIRTIYTFDCSCHYPLLIISNAWHYQTVVKSKLDVFHLHYNRWCQCVWRETISEQWRGARMAEFTCLTCTVAVWSAPSPPATTPRSQGLRSPARTTSSLLLVHYFKFYFNFKETGRLPLDLTLPVFTGPESVQRTIKQRKGVIQQTRYLF